MLILPVLPSAPGHVARYCPANTSWVASGNDIPSPPFWAARCIPAHSVHGLNQLLARNSKPTWNVRPSCSSVPCTPRTFAGGHDYVDLHRSSSLTEGDALSEVPTQPVVAPDPKNGHRPARQAGGDSRDKPDGYGHCTSTVISTRGNARAEWGPSTPFGIEFFPKSRRTSLCFGDATAKCADQKPCRPSRATRARRTFLHRRIEPAIRPNELSTRSRRLPIICL